MRLLLARCDDEARNYGRRFVTVGTANNWTNLRIGKADARKGSIKRGCAAAFPSSRPNTSRGIRRRGGHVVAILIASSLSLGPRLPTIYRARCIVIGLQSGRNRVANYRAASKIHLQMIILLIEVPPRRHSAPRSVRFVKGRIMRE